MRGAFHSGHAFAAFDRVVRRCEAWLAGNGSAVAGCVAVEVRERLVQRIVETTLNDFVRVCGRRSNAGEAPIPPGGQRLRLGGLTLRPDNGEVTISAGLVARSVADFAIHWLLLFGAILGGCLPRVARRKGPATLLFGVGVEGLLHHGNDARFVRFCRQGPISPLNRAQRVVVQAVKIDALRNSEFEYGRFPVAHLIRSTRLTWTRRAMLLLVHLRSPVTFAAAVGRCRPAALLARDFAVVSAVEYLDRAHLLEAVLITNSQFLSQPLWMRGRARNFRVHEIHYAQNIRPIVYREDHFAADHPAYRHVRVDEHWVWTSGHGDYLKKLGHEGAVHVVGPLLWYLPEPPPARNGDEIRVAVFDVTPVRDEVAAQIGFVDNYYNTRNMMRFIEEVVSVCSELSASLGTRVRVLLKHKRQFNPNHDGQYTELIARLSGERQLELLPSNESLYSLLSGSDLSISVSYTSTAYVSSAVGCPAIYYDPTGLLAETFEPAPGIAFAGSRADLMRAAAACAATTRPRQRRADAI